ncbi:MAG: HD domain-containing phosphohydrolase [Spirochaetia bacterium]|jgi:response regulator RpfG family c-di-GMP phosphodiesterase
MKRDTQKLLRTIESLSTIKDLDSLLESILTEARQFLMADAGTIYLAARGFLYFSFVQNDTLFRGETKDKYIPSGGSLPIDKASLAGYVAKTGEPILIDDVYHIQSDVSFSFNPAFDQETHYRTRSILGVPLKTRENEIVGVLQLINAKSESGEVVAFSVDDKLFISQFAKPAADAIDKARMSRELVLRMVDLVELRDPFETSQHAKRVGAYSVELYEKWAGTRNISAREIRKVREVLRIAAMLHDVGKVAVSDTILKKSGQLSYDEKLSMRLHTVLGARLFRRATSFWDDMSSEVALNHHENWDGSGYPGRIEDLYAEKIYMGPGKQGTEIPLSARVVTIADVYDALVSQRAYKNGWRQEHALHYIRYQAGKKFDPELVGIFLKMGDLLTAIAKKYSY